MTVIEAFIVFAVCELVIVAVFYPLCQLFAEFDLCNPICGIIPYVNLAMLTKVFPDDGSFNYYICGKSINKYFVYFWWLPMIFIPVLPFGTLLTWAYLAAGLSVFFYYLLRYFPETVNKENYLQMCIMYGILFPIGIHKISGLLKRSEVNAHYE